MEERIPLSERFWSKVDRSGGPEACWLWTAYKSKDGYGRFGYQGDVVNAQRVSYDIAHPDAPLGSKFALHRCDNRACVNPAHLFAGTNADNMHDMARKGRAQRGETHSKAKLTVEDVLFIREHGQTAREQGLLAKQFGLSRTSVRQVVAHETWRHI